MPDNPSTDNPPIETEAWEIAFKPYATDADAAFDMARRLMEVKRYLKAKPPNPSIGSGGTGRSCRASLSVHRVLQGVV